jgi:hypothetical protein
MAKLKQAEQWLAGTFDAVSLWDRNSGGRLFNSFSSGY